MRSEIGFYEHEYGSGETTVASSFSFTMDPAVLGHDSVDQITTPGYSESRDPPTFHAVQANAVAENIKTPPADVQPREDTSAGADAVVTEALTEAKFSQPSPEDGLQIIDISMWTQQSPESSTTRQPSLSDEQSRADTFVSRCADNLSQHERFESPGSESNDIPFAIGGRSQDFTSAETIVLPPSTTDVTARNGLKVRIQEIRCIEGPPSLGKLALHLYEQLKSYCQVRGTDYPDIMKTVWPVSSLQHTAKGNRTWFESPQNDEHLAAARYRYGKHGQFIVVRDESGRRFNGGKAAIVFHGESNKVQRQVNGRSYALHKWHVWDPFGELPQPLWCWKVIEGTLLTPNSITDSKALPLAVRPENLPVVVSGSAKASPIKRVNPSRSTETLRTESAPDTMRKLSRLSTAIEARHTAKKARLSLDNIEDIISRTNDPSSHVGARRDEATGEIFMKRQSDGKTVMLRCPECDSDSVQTQQGLFNHMLRSHDIRLADREAVAEHCGVLVDETTLPNIPTITAERGRGSETFATTPLRTQPLRQSVQRVMNPPASTDIAVHQNSEALFVFMRSHGDKNPRMRSSSSVNTAEKLYVNALVAGVARRDTLMLTVAVDKDPPFHIVKNDKEDFALVMERIQKSKYKNPEVIITVEELDD